MELDPGPSTGNQTVNGVLESLPVSCDETRGMIGLAIAAGTRPGESIKMSMELVTRSCLFLIILIDSGSGFSTENSPNLRTRG